MTFAKPEQEQSRRPERAATPDQHRLATLAREITVHDPTRETAAKSPIRPRGTAAKGTFVQKESGDRDIAFDAFERTGTEYDFDCDRVFR